MYVSPIFEKGDSIDIFIHDPAFGFQTIRLKIIAVNTDTIILENNIRVHKDKIFIIHKRYGIDIINPDSEYMKAQRII